MFNTTCDLDTVLELMKWATTILILKMWKLRLKRIKRFANEGHSQDLKPGQRSHSTVTQ